MTQKICTAAIAAMAENRVIGKNGTLIWHLPEDLKHFKHTTMGKPIIMGRKSYDSLGKPLPGRPNLVVSRAHKNLKNQPTGHFDAMESVGPAGEKKVNEGPFLYATIEDSIAAAKAMAAEMGADEIFITGGGEIYKQTMPLTERLYLTIIHRDYEGDTFFPEINWDEWKTVDKQEHQGNPPFTFLTLERK